MNDEKIEALARELSTLANYPSRHEHVAAIAQALRDAHAAGERAAREADAGLAENEAHEYRLNGCPAEVSVALDQFAETLRSLIPAEDHGRNCPLETGKHDHGFSPHSSECAACVSQDLVFNSEVFDQKEREWKAEIERLQDAWFQDEGIAPDGDLRALVSRTVKRAADGEALLGRIHRLTDPNATRSSSPTAQSKESKDG